MTDMTRRDHYICAALIGLMAAEDGAPSPEMMANGAVHLADAALAAAGEKEDPVLHEDCISIDTHNAVMDRLQADFDKLHAEIARLKRQAEPLTEEEARKLSDEDMALPTEGIALRVDRAITAAKERRV